MDTKKLKDQVQIDELRKQLETLEEKKWDSIEASAETAGKFRTAHMIYCHGLVKENEALDAYMELLSHGCSCDGGLDDEDKKVIMEIIADELNHVRKLQALAKKYQIVKAALK